MKSLPGSAIQKPGLVGRSRSQCWIAWCVLLMGLCCGHSAQPRLVFERSSIQALLGEAYTHALANLLETNVVKADRRHQRSGLIHDPPGKYIRAGADYQEPWTRDASVNSWNAASLLAPDLARNTLWAVCERTPDGRLIVQQDNQWWDQVVWITAAWNHYATTADRHFLESAYETGDNTLQVLLHSRFDATYGLFQGPSHLADGIAGYPEPFNDPPGSSSFILDHPGADKMMTLSANCLYYQAFRSMAKMALALNKEQAMARRWDRAADKLRSAINQQFWMKAPGSYAYFLHGAGQLRGQKAAYQEATGLSLAILFGIPDRTRQRRIFQSVRTSKWGIPLVEPDFSRYTPAQPARHGRVVWPMAQGYWATAAAHAGQLPLFQKEVETMAQLAQGTGWNFMEIYNPETGKPDGGWQCGRHWNSCANQTWSATAFIRAIHCGLFGMRFEPQGIAFSPLLPVAWGSVTLRELKYRGMTLEIRLSGSGNRIARYTVDGQRQRKPFLPGHLTGPHSVELRLAD